MEPAVAAVAVHVGFAALRAVIGEVLRLIKKGKNKIKGFKPEVERLESTLKRVLPKLKKIRDSNGEISDTLKAEMERLIAKLNRAKKLVRDCTPPRKLDNGKKLQISKMLIDVDESVVRFFQVDVPLDIWETTKGIESLLGGLASLSETKTGRPDAPIRPGHRNMSSSPNKEKKK